MSNWQCTNCTLENSSDNFLCKTCRCARATSTRKIRPPVQFRGKFMDKKVSDLVQKATKRKPSRLNSDKSDKRERVKRAIKKKVEDMTPSQKRRESLMEKQFKAKADQITKLAQELENIKTSMMGNNSSNFGGIEDQLKSIGEIMVTSSIFSSPPAQTVSKIKKISKVSDFDPSYLNSSKIPMSGIQSKRKVSVIYDTDSDEDDADNGDEPVSDKEWKPTSAINKTPTKTSPTKKLPARDKNSKKRYLACDECEFQCSSQSYLNEHKLTHINKTPFNCEYEGCEFKGTSKYFLLQHIGKVHADVPKPFPCDKCSLAYHDKASLSRHQKTHDTIKKSARKKDAIKTIVPKKKVAKPKKTVPAKKISDADDLALEVEVIQSFIDDDIDAGEEPADKNDDDWVPDDVPDDDEKGTEVSKKSKTLKTKEPKEVKEKQPCPHDDCDYKSASEVRMKRHRKNVHKEVFPRQKRDITQPPKPRVKRIRCREKKFSCDICGMKATSMWYINRHRRSHTGEKPFVCEHENCDYRAFRKYHLTRHIINIHSEERPYKCEVCDYHAKTREGARQHYISMHVTERNQKCKYCDYASKSKDSLRGHTRTIHKYICETCVWEFITDEQKVLHMSRHQDDGKILCHLCSHIANDINDLKEHCMLVHERVIETRIPRKRSKAFPVCEICQYQFPNEMVLHSHKTQHTAHGLVCSVCNHLFGDMELLRDHCIIAHGFGIDAQRKRERQARTIFNCTVCSYEFPSEYALKIHSERHRPDGSMVCGQCSHISIKMSDHIEHSRNMHDISIDAEHRRKRNFYCCDICKYLFSSQQLLEIHKLQHLSDGSVQCGHCPAIMSKMKNLEDHMILMHSIKLDATLQRVRPYLFCCPVCNYMFENKEQLNGHRLRHLPDGSIACELCPYTAPEMEFLKLHMIEVHNTVLNSEKKRHKRKKGDPPKEYKRPKRPYKKSVANRNQLSQIPNHNITDILYGANNHDAVDQEYNSPILNRQYTNTDVSSYITPPSCAFDPSSTPNSLNFDTRVQNPFASLTSTHNISNIFNTLNGSHSNKETSVVDNFVNQANNNLPLTISNSHSVSNNFNFNHNTINISTPIICGSNRDQVINTTVPSSLHTAPISIDLSSLIPGGVPPTPGLHQNSDVSKSVMNKTPKKLPIKGSKKDTPLKSSDPSPRLKAFPGLFM